MASSMASTCSPTSLQLRLALNCRKCRGSPVLLILQARATRIDRHSHKLCASHIGYGVQRPRYGSPWTASSSAAADNFAGWTDSGDGDQSVETQKKKWIQGMVGAGVAGIILVAGLTFAALSLSKRTTLKTKQQMEPLTVQQEVSLVSDDEEDKIEKNTSAESSANLKEEYISLEHKTNTDVDLPSSPQIEETHNENKLSGDTDQLLSADNGNYIISSNDTVDNAPVQEDLQYDSAFDSKLGVLETTPNSTNLPESKIAKIDKNLVNGEPAYSLNIINTITEHTEAKENTIPSSDSSISPVLKSSEPVVVSTSITLTSDTVSEVGNLFKDGMDSEASVPTKEELNTSTNQVSTDRNSSSLEMNYLTESGSSGVTSVSEWAYPFANKQDIVANDDMNLSKTSSESPPFSGSFSSAGVPAPSAVPESLQVSPGKILVPAVVDQTHGQALAALQVLKVIEADVQPSDLCTRREYARWLVAASSALSRSTLSKVYPAMYIENATEPAFDDITPDDPDFSSIQGLAEAGLISSRLSNHDLLSPVEDQGPLNFSPESPLSRQDLVSWKMALEKRQLPEANRKILYQLSGFRDVDKIHPDAWPALIADLSAGDQGIISLAFGCTRLFQPNKPVTKAQAAVALAIGEASDIVNEELARIEAESMAENAVSAHNALVAQVEQDINASFEKELLMEREKINAVEKMAEEARLELERLRAEREADNFALMKERASIEAEMEVLSRLKGEVEEQLQTLLSSKVEISYEKERINKLQKEAENEKQEISRLQYELEVERKALSIARAWAEDEAKRAREHAKVIEEARDRWERQGIKVVVDNDLREETSAGGTWVATARQFSVEGTVSRAEKLVGELKLLADNARGKSKEVINTIIQKILVIISRLKEWISEARTQAGELKDAAVLKAKESVEELQKNTSEFSSTIKERARGSIYGLQQSTAEFSFAMKEGAKRVAGDCREGVERLTQRFKS
ncbi:conserved hypothetical protein [Ricinus communis]|uniref:SLH domain-containing protein n=1 Tax=Ricinus communis TaxID=3988 RepID=B9RIX1_RICCO|nr:conserved hypothetical protein [Ricinus communis]|eukprot:XP_002513690.1 uncharacterized protein LOC8281004 isoform X1 [Ricinus communis]